MLLTFCKNNLPKHWQRDFITEKPIRIEREEKCLFSEKRIKELVNLKGFFTFDNDSLVDFSIPDGLPDLSVNEIFAISKISQSLLDKGIGHDGYLNGREWVINIKGVKQLINWHFDSEITKQAENNHYTQFRLMNPTARINENQPDSWREYFQKQGRSLRFLRLKDTQGEKNYRIWLEKNNISEIHCGDLNTPGISVWNPIDAMMQLITGNSASFELNQKNLQGAAEKAVQHAKENGYLFCYIKNILIKKVPGKASNEAEIFINLELGPRLEIIGQRLVFDPLIPENVQKNVRRAATTRLLFDTNFALEDLDEVLRDRGLKCYNLTHKPVGQNKAVRLLFIGRGSTIPVTNINVYSNRTNSTIVGQMMRKWGIVLGSNKTDQRDLNNFLNSFGVANGDKNFRPEVDSQGNLTMQCSDGQKRLTIGKDSWMKLLDINSNGGAFKFLGFNDYLMNQKLLFKENFLGAKVNSGVFKDLSNILKHIGIEFDHKVRGSGRYSEYEEQINYKLPILDLAKSLIMLKSQAHKDELLKELDRNDLIRQLFNFTTNGGFTGRWHGGQASINFTFDSNQQERFSKLHKAMSSVLMPIRSGLREQQGYEKTKGGLSIFRDLVDKYGTSAAEKFVALRMENNNNWRQSQNFWFEHIIDEKEKKYTKQEKKILKTIYTKEPDIIQENYSDTYEAPLPYFYPKLVCTLKGQQNLLKTQNFHTDVEGSFSSSLSNAMSGDFIPRCEAKGKFELTNYGPNVSSALIIKGAHALNPLREVDYADVDGGIGNLIELSEQNNEEEPREWVEFDDLNINSTASVNLMFVRALGMLVNGFVVAELLWGAQAIWAQSSIDQGLSSNFVTAGVYFAFGINLMGSTRLIVYIYFDIFGGFKLHFCFHPLSTRLAQKTLRRSSNM